MRATISGAGKYIPKKVMKNRDLEKMVDTNDDWILTRTGISERHIASSLETTSSMGAEAAKKALKMSGLAKEDIEMIIFASMSHDKLFPASACLVQDELKIPRTGTVDIEAACSGFVYGLSLANAYVVSGMFKNVLVIGADTMSRIVDWTDRNTCVLFGDGAGAAIVSRSEDENSGFLGFRLRGDGSYKNLLYMEAGGSFKPASHESVEKKEHFLRMNGHSTFKIAVRMMSDVLEDLTKEHKLELPDIDIVIPHQANRRIIEGVAERLSIPLDSFYINLNKYGNTSAATIPIALTEALEEKRIRKGNLVAFVALGGGFTWGSALLRW
jgi:3-oxoacyl-[acyl-carrier-protein] synthase-3